MRFSRARSPWIGGRGHPALRLDHGSGRHGGRSTTTRNTGVRADRRNVLLGDDRGGDEHRQVLPRTPTCQTRPRAQSSEQGRVPATEPGRADRDPDLAGRPRLSRDKTEGRDAETTITRRRKRTAGLVEQTDGPDRTPSVVWLAAAQRIPAAGLQTWRSPCPNPPVSDRRRAAIGVDFVSLAEGIDATTPAGRLQLHILGAIAEFERARIVERVNAGLARAKAQGKTLGRPRKVNGVQVPHGLTVRGAAHAWGVSKSTAANWLNQGRVPGVGVRLPKGNTR